MVFLKKSSKEPSFQKIYSTDFFSDLDLARKKNFFRLASGLQEKKVGRPLALGYRFFLIRTHFPRTHPLIPILILTSTPLPISDTRSIHTPPHPPILPRPHTLLRFESCGTREAQHSDRVFTGSPRHGGASRLERAGCHRRATDPTCSKACVAQTQRLDHVGAPRHTQCVGCVERQVQQISKNDQSCCRSM